MVSAKVTVMNPKGFHTASADVFANKMGAYESDVFIFYNGHEINGKSLINILSSQIKCGAEIKICCSGVDEQLALQKSIALIRGEMGE